MAVHDSPNGPVGAAGLPTTVPFELSHVTRMSWKLGSRTVRDETAATLGKWERRPGNWSLSFFGVTDETAVVRVRTPVGRELFYGAIRSEVRTAMQEIEAAPVWRATE